MTTLYKKHVTYLKPSLSSERLHPSHNLGSNAKMIFKLVSIIPHCLLCWVYSLLESRYELLNTGI